MKGRVANMFNGPYFAGKRNDVGSGPDELERGGPVQSIPDDGKRAVIIAFTNEPVLGSAGEPSSTPPRRPARAHKVYGRS